MILYIVSKLWFSPYSDYSFRNSQKRLLAIMIFSVSILIAVGAIFSGFEQALQRYTVSGAKEVVLYMPFHEYAQVRKWVEEQPQVQNVVGYGRQMVRIACQNYEGFAMVTTDPKYHNDTALMSPLLFAQVAGCADVTVTGYDLSQIFPVPHEISIRYKVFPGLGGDMPLLIVSSGLYKKLGYNIRQNTMLSFKLPSDKDVRIFMQQGPYGHLHYVDMSQWGNDFAKALHVQKAIMWIVMGLMMVLALFQLKHFLEDVMDHQKMFWSLMCLHGVSHGLMVRIFCLFSAGFVGATMLFSIPVGVAIAAGMDPMIHFVEKLSGHIILDPEFFVLDHIPYHVTVGDIVAIESILAVMAIVCTLYALRGLYKVDVMLVLRNG